jgi:aspartate kinase
MSVVVSDKQLQVGGVSKNEQILEDLGSLRPDSITAAPGMALVATVGLGMNHAIGTAARLFSALAKARVNVRMIDQGSSEQNLIVGIEEADLATAIRAIYNEFA